MTSGANFKDPESNVQSALPLFLNIWVRRFTKSPSTLLGITFAPPGTYSAHDNTCPVSTQGFL